MLPATDALHPRIDDAAERKGLHERRLLAVVDFLVEVHVGSLESSSNFCEGRRDRQRPPRLQHQHHEACQHHHHHQDARSSLAVARTRDRPQRLQFALLAHQRGLVVVSRPIYDDPVVTFPRRASSAVASRSPDVAL